MILDQLQYPFGIKTIQKDAFAASEHRWKDASAGCVRDGRDTGEHRMLPFNVSRCMPRQCLPIEMRCHRGFEHTRGAGRIEEAENVIGIDRFDDIGQVRSIDQIFVAAQAALCGIVNAINFTKLLYLGSEVETGIFDFLHERR